jgi:hypothetical protein
MKERKNKDKKRCRERKRREPELRLDHEKEHPRNFPTRK